MKTMDSPLDRVSDAEDRPGRIHVRAIRSTDSAELGRFYRGLSAESRRMRLFSTCSGLSNAQSVSLCTTDHDHREGFVAVVDGLPGDQERIVGHLCLEPDGAAAEVAIAVADEFQHQGVGRRLMAAGVAWARDEHISALTATMLSGNAPIHRLLAGLDLPSRLSYVGVGVAEITIELVAQTVAA